MYTLVIWLHYAKLYTLQCSNHLYTRLFYKRVLATNGWLSRDLVCTMPCLGSSQKIGGETSKVLVLTRLEPSFAHI